MFRLLALVTGAATAAIALPALVLPLAGPAQAARVVFLDRPDLSALPEGVAIAREDRVASLARRHRGQDMAGIGQRRAHARLVGERQAARAGPRHRPPLPAQGLRERAGGIAQAEDEKRGHDASDNVLGSNRKSGNRGRLV